MRPRTEIFWSALTPPTTRNSATSLEPHPPRSVRDEPWERVGFARLPRRSPMTNNCVFGSTLPWPTTALSQTNAEGKNSRPAERNSRPVERRGRDTGRRRYGHRASSQRAGTASRQARKRQASDLFQRCEAQSQALGLAVGEGHSGCCVAPGPFKGNDLAVAKTLVGNRVSDGQAVGIRN